MDNLISDTMLEISQRVLEDEENFIFEAIKPYCEEIVQRKISKQELKDALLLWEQAKKSTMRYKL
jgi:hypothetical protein